MGFQIIKYDTDYKSHVISSIPPDEVCVVFLPGALITPGEDTCKINYIVTNEYLDNIPNVSNYVVGYVYDNTQQLIPMREIQYDKHNKNVLGINKTVSGINNRFNLYITKNNINRVFNRIILPVLRERQNIKFTYIIDGDFEQTKHLVEQKLNSFAKQLRYKNREIDEMCRYIYPYKKNFEPEYLDKMFNAILLPRITDNVGERLPLELAQQQIRKINFIAHCHGAYIALMMHERMKIKMQELGYSNTEINKIFSQLLVVALNPDCPLSVTHSPFISFCSGHDIQEMYKEAKHAGNHIIEFVITHLSKIKTGFLGDNAGNVFFVNHRFYLIEDKERMDAVKLFMNLMHNNLIDNTTSANEHNNIHITHTEHTDEGKLLMRLMHNIIQSGIHNSMSQNSEFNPLPNISNLILDGKNDSQITKEFNQMVINGKKFLKDVYESAKQSKITNKHAPNTR